MSAPDQASAKALHAPDASQTEVTGATDRAQLRTDYEGLGKRMRHWLLLGAALLALPLLWWLLPTERRLVPAATRGYRWRQAGTVQDSGTTWVWALADSAGQARLLLSRTRGRTWVARKLGVPAAQARALALGWGSPWRGVLLGQKGELRVLPNVLREPQRGEPLQSPTTTAVGLALDTQGRQLVLADSLNGAWQTLDAGKSWQKWAPNLATRTITPLALPQVAHVLFEPTRQRFFAISGYYRQQPSPQTQAANPPSDPTARSFVWEQTDVNGVRWQRTTLPTFIEVNAPVLYAGPSVQGHLLIVYRNGNAIQLSSSNTAKLVIGKFRLISDLPLPPVALALARQEESSADTAAFSGDSFQILNDSSLLFEAATEGGRIRRFSLGAPARLETQNESARPQAPVQPRPTPASTAATAVPTPRQSPKRPKPKGATVRTNTTPKPSTSSKPPANKDYAGDTAAATPNQSPVQQMPAAKRPTSKSKD